MTAILSVASGLGGALIGAVAGVYGPRSIDSRRRQHEWALERQRLQDVQTAREAEARLAERARETEARVRVLTAMREEKEKALAAIAEATVCVQDWHRLVEWTLQDVSAGRGVDAAKFDETAERTLQAVVRAVSVLSNNAFMSDPVVRGRQAPRPVTLTMQELTVELRSQVVAPRDDFDGSRMFRYATEIREDLMKLFISERSMRTDQPPFRVGVHTAAISVSPDRGER
ncbi:hypothetical protein ACFC96_44660 [Streptomyces sp. NPDC055955]|uniref:hypothetical protein n=1 Tax=Streptomyces sp. NPDC055955 TaxID=3345665 RepID=UPI0035E22DDA